ncbi:unnamed protein product [Bathycoccus prasinos]
MASYYIHAGRTIEEAPMREGSLYLYDKEGWYDFFANSTSVTSDGYCDDSTIGMKHVAVRDAGRESTFKPNKNNMFPRPKDWKPTKSNTHKEHFKE